MFNKKEIIDILKSDVHSNYLFKLADRVRKYNTGDGVHLRGLIEFSNICSRTCRYCGLRCANKKLERYRIAPDEIIKYALNAAKMGYKTIVLQSGEDSYYSQKTMCKVISEIKKFDVAITLSIGERSFRDYKEFKNSGADRYLLRIETTDPDLYRKMHPNMDYKNRLRCLVNLKELGYEVGTGNLVGLPGQTIESLAEDILFFKKINADMVGIGPFIPHPNTPLKAFAPGTFNLALKVMALTRILLKDINIPATTAMETLHPKGRIIALQSGANVVMPNVTKTEYRKKYEIYPNKICINENPVQCRYCIENKINLIGRYIAQDKGFRRHQSA